MCCLPELCTVLLFPPPAVKPLNPCLQQYMVGIQIPSDTVMYSSGMQVFPSLKFIKNCLSTRLSQDNLEALMLKATEEDVLMNLDSDDVIDRVVEKSKLICTLLIA